MATIYLALGSNLGDRLKYFRQAISALLPWVQPISYSPVYETPPWGITDQPAFLNQVLQAETSLAPQRLLKFLKGIESHLGRKQTARFGPRIIDLDILFYDNLVINTDKLSIPHPRLHERAFVLVPLAALEPGLVHPVLGQTVSQMLQQVDAQGITLFPVETPLYPE